MTYNDLEFVAPTKSGLDWIRPDQMMDWVLNQITDRIMEQIM